MRKFWHIWVLSRHIWAPSWHIRPIIWHIWASTLYIGLSSRHIWASRWQIWDSRYHIWAFFFYQHSYRRSIWSSSDRFDAQRNLQTNFWALAIYSWIKSHKNVLQANSWLSDAVKFFSYHTTFWGQNKEGVPGYLSVDLSVVPSTCK